MSAVPRGYPRCANRSGHERRGPQRQVAVSRMRSRVGSLGRLAHTEGRKVEQRAFSAVGRKRRLSHALSPSVFPSGDIPLLPLSKNNVELMEEAETSLLPKDMSRLRVESDQSTEIVTPTRDP
jgi:hypothetical protein